MDRPPFDPADLAQNPDFVAWVLRPTPLLVARWQAASSRSAADAEAIAQARALVLFLHRPDPLPAHLPDADWQRLQRTLALDRAADFHPPAPRRAGRVLRLPGRWGWLAAASVTLLLVAGLAWQAWVRQPVVVRTASGQLRTLTLPDGSRVTLNANSRLRYQPGGWGRFDRRVWLEGEAFFEIQKTTDRRRFVVHTDQTAVEVLGTQFDVLARRRRTHVVLLEGRVELRTPARPPLALTPGDWVQVAEHRTTRRRVRPDAYRAWTEHRLVFEAVPLADVLQTLEDRYGYRIQLADPALGQRTYTGVLPALPDGGTLVRAVAETYGLRLTRSDSLFVLHP